MFVISEANAAAIRAIFHERGVFSAPVELRRLFPGIKNTEQALANRGLEVASSSRTCATARQQQLLNRLFLVL
jgi:hypothetical protein